MILLRQFTNIILCLLLFCALLPEGFAQAEGGGARVLVIRADKLAETAISKQIAVSPRNPFAWPPGQIKKFNRLEKGQLVHPFAGFELQGIIWNKEQPLAVINGSLVRQGESLKDVYIRKISPRQVVLESMGRYHTLAISTIPINLGGSKE